MSYLDIVYFSVVLFAALVTLNQWKKRRDQFARMRRGLSSFVSDGSNPPA